MLIVGESRQALNHDDFHNLRARPLQRLVSVPRIANGGLVARPPLHNASEGLDPASARDARSSPGESTLIGRPRSSRASAARLPLLTWKPTIAIYRSALHDAGCAAP
jgi:hypothetical protein